MGDGSKYQVNLLLVSSWICLCGDHLALNIYLKFGSFTCYVLLVNEGMVTSYTLNELAWR